MFKDPDKNFKLNEFKLNNTISLKEKFEKLTYEWKIRYGMLSLGDEIFNNDYYNSIIDLGKEVLPLMIEEMRNNKNTWFDAFYKLIGIWPVPKEITKTLDVRKYLVSWYDKNKDKL